VFLVKDLVIYHNISTIPTTKAYSFIPDKLLYPNSN